MCQQCQIKPVYEFTNKRKLCARCFINWFQKKFLYIVRKFKMLKEGDVVGYINDKDFCGVVLEDLLKMFAEKGTVRLVKLRSQARDIDKVINTKTSKGGVNVVAVSNTTDIESYKVINEIIKGNEKNLKNLGPVIGKVIKPLYLFLDKEILIYAKLKKLKFKSLKHIKDKIGLFVEELEKKHPELKHAVVSSYLELYG